MADYIYLIQNRLTPAQWRALEAVREAARAQSMPVFLVGGAVRDLTTGTPVRDLDFAVQGDARSLLSELQGKGAVLAGENAVLSGLYLTFRGGVRVEIAPTQTVSYPKPGKPETKTAPILDDLRRRDFTANSMAVSLNEGSYGLLLDPLNGTADIENRELRLVSPYGFIEQPALLLRAARLGERLGWSLEARTQSRYETSKEEDHIKALPDADRRYELEEIFHEEDPLTLIDHMAAEGWLNVLSPGLRASDGDRHGLDEVRDLIGQLEGQGLHPDPSAIFFPLVTAKLSEVQRTALKGLFARQGFAQQIDSLEARSKELAAQLTAKAATPSETFRLIHEADAEVMLHLAYLSRSGAVQAKIKAFLKEWPQMRQRIPYAQMQEMRITPDLPGYDKLLDDLFFALIDGKLDTPEATRAFLEPFSPPAPVQVPTRKRPAKSVRGRGKRGTQGAAEPVEDLDNDETDDRRADDRESDDEAEPVRRSRQDDDEEDDASQRFDDDEDDDAALTDADTDEDDEEDESKAELDSSTPRTPAKKVAAAKSAVDVDLTTTQKAAKTATKSARVVPAVKGSKVVAAALDEAETKASAKDVIVVKKASPAKSVTEKPTKVASKLAEKTPAKSVPAAKQVIKVAANKTPAKKVAEKQVLAAPAKKGVSVKAAPVKTAVKGRGGR